MPGLRSGEPIENFVLLSIDSAYSLTRVAKSGIGILGILDRNTTIFSESVNQNRHRPPVGGLSSSEIVLR